MFENPYEQRYREQMDVFAKDLWQHLDKITSLEENLANQVLGYLLELACQAQNELNIKLGRQALQAIPREWLLAHITARAEPLVVLHEEWEYRRLLELYQSLDADLTSELLSRGLVSPNLEIRETAQGYLNQ